MNEALPLLLRLYAFPGVVAIAAVALACMVCRPWARRLLLALAVVLIVPIPVESRTPPAVIVPLGLFLMLATAFPKMVCLIVFHTTCLAAMLWLVGIAGGGLKRWIRRDSRRVSLFVGFGLLFAGVAVATVAVALATYHTAFDAAFRGMKYPNAQVEEPMKPYETISEGYEVRWRTMDSMDDVMTFYKKKIGYPLHGDGSCRSACVDNLTFWTSGSIQVGRDRDGVGITVWVARNNDRSIPAIWKKCMRTMGPERLLSQR